MNANTYLANMQAFSVCVMHVCAYIVREPHVAVLLLAFLHACSSFQVIYPKSPVLLCKWCSSKHKLLSFLKHL